MEAPTYPQFPLLKQKRVGSARKRDSGKKRVLGARWKRRFLIRSATILELKNGVMDRETSREQPHEPLDFFIWTVEECEHPGEVLDMVNFFELVHSSNKKDPTNSQASNEEAVKKNVAGINSMESLDFGHFLNLIKKPDNVQANCHDDDGLTDGSGLSNSTC